MHNIKRTNASWFQKSIGAMTQLIKKIFMSKDVNFDELFVFTLQHILYDPFPLKYNNGGLLLIIQTHMKVSLPTISESR
jgi:hypothetical protein